MAFLKSIFGLKTNTNTIKKMLHNGATVIDVRTPVEFNKGSVQNAINIPLQDFNDRIEDVLNLKTPIVLCCRSGLRSKQALSILKKKRKDCSNGGSWQNVQSLLPLNN